jgi:hypothetical protein
LVASIDRESAIGERLRPDLRVVWLVSLCACLSLGLLLTPNVVVDAFRGIGRGGFGLFIMLLLFVYPAAAGLAGLGLGVVARHAVRDSRGHTVILFLGLAGLAFAVVVPFGWHVTLGGGSSSYGVYLIFIPASILTGAQIALLGPAVAVREVSWPVPLLSAASIVAVGIGAPLAIYTLYWGFIPEFLEEAALAFASAGLALDAAIAMQSRRLSSGHSVPAAP